MDPTTTLADLLIACGANDRELATEALDELRDWMAKDGYLPHLDEAVRKCLMHAKFSTD